MKFEPSVPPSPAPPEPESIPRRIASLGERYLSVATAVAVLRKAPDKPFDERPYKRLGIRIEEHMAELRRMKAGATGMLMVVEALTLRLVEAEALLLALDAGLTPAALDALFESSPGPEDALRYAAFLARAFQGEPDRSDKMGRLLIRALVHEERGVRKIRPWPLAEPALWYVVGGPSRASAGTRASAVGFFRGAMKRVEAFKDVDGVFSSGLVLDVRGYRTAVREALLDPEVLYASVELEFAFLARLFLLAEQSRRSRVTVLARLGEEAKKADSILASSEPEAAAKIAERVEKKKEKVLQFIAQPPPRSKPAGGRHARTGMAVALGILFVLTVAGLRRAGRSDSAPPQASSEEVTALSRHIESGAYSGQAADSVFIGNIAPSWAKLSADAKQKEAEAIAAKLTQRRVPAAVVSEGDTTVIRVSRGKVILAN